MSRRNLLFCTALAVSSLILFWPTTDYEFVNYDDNRYVYENSVVTAGLTMRGVGWALTTTYFSYWHPLTWLSHMFDCEMYGLNAAGHHLSSVLWHAINAAFLFVVLFEMTGLQIRSAVVAALFAVHPLHVESVAWIAERKDVLSTFFLLGTIWAYGRYACRGSRVEGQGQRHYQERSTLNVQRPTFKAGTEGEEELPTSNAQRPTFKWRWYALALVCFAAGVMSKPMVVTLPFVLLLLDFWPLNRICAIAPGNLLSLAREKLPFFALAAIGAAITYFGVRGAGNVISEEQISWTMRLENVPVSYARYLVKTLWPTDLAVLYPLPADWPAWQVTAATIVVLLITAACIYQVRRARYMLVGWLWFVGTLVPTIGLIPVGHQSIADRYTYVPHIGLFIMAVWTAADWASTRKLRQWTAGIVTGIALAFCWVGTRLQLPHWQNTWALWSHALTVTRDNAPAQFAMGILLEERGQTEEAKAHYREALRIQPSHIDANMNLGVLLLRENRLSEATGFFVSALRRQPGYYLAHLNLSEALFAAGDLPGASNQLTLAIRSAPRNAPSHSKFGAVLSELNHLEKASEHFSEALKWQPDYPEAMVGLGKVRLRQGRYWEATDLLTKCLSLKPELAEAHLALAGAFTATGAARKAVAHYKTYLQYVILDAAALNDLAWILATTRDDEIRDGAEAVRLASKACEISQNREPMMLGTLAAAHAANGEFKQAIQRAEQAAEVARGKGNIELAKRNEQLLKLYRRGEAYRE